MQLEAISLGIQSFFRKSDKSDEMADEITENPSEEYQKMAREIKEGFDQKYEKTWHCIVGDNFGCFVTHEKQNFIFFQIANISILIFKTAKPESLKTK